MDFDGRARERERIFQVMKLVRRRRDEWWKIENFQLELTTHSQRARSEVINLVEM